MILDDGDNRPSVEGAIGVWRGKCQWGKRVGDEGGGLSKGDGLSSCFVILNLFQDQFSTNAGRGCGTVDAEAS